MCRIFSEKIYDYLYSDTDFVRFLNTFYSSYDLSTQDLSIYLSNKEEISDFNLYLRLFLVNVNPFIILLSDLNKKMSTKYVSVTKDYIGQIKGHLNIDKYIKSKISRRHPKVYPSKIKEKSYNTPENIYILFYSMLINEKLRYLIKYLNRSLKTRNCLIKERVLISDNINTINEFINSPQFTGLYKEVSNLKRRYGSSLPLQHLETIIHRLRKGKLVNSETYVKIITWIKDFENKNLISEGGNSKILRYNDKLFCDKLFEIWNLYKIMKTLVEDFDYKLIKENPIIGREDEYIFYLRDKNDVVIYIYFQKGQGLYWGKSSDRNWAYINEKGEKEAYLRGIPDITVQIEGTESKLIMIDAKNKIRKLGQNSEEIYKLIGYYDNFKDSVPKSKIFNKSFIIFRNEEQPFIENLIDKDKRMITNYSVGINENHETNTNQFIKLCKELLKEN